jgi:hypothetical protein
MIEAVELGAKKTALAKAMKISRTTLDQNIKIKEYFGITGLIQGYKFSDSTNKREQRELHSASRISGDRTEQIKEIEAKGKLKINGNVFNFAESTSVTKKLKAGEHIFSNNHDWQETRYAGIFLYLIVLIQQWRWMELIIGYFGSAYKIFMVFLLMATKDIRSIEQLKNIRLKEAGAILGIEKLPSLPKVWGWFYNAAEKNVSINLLTDYFRFQIRGGLVGVWQWFTDGHLLPYTGKEKVHYSYNTQRRMPVPGQSNLVTCDINGNIVDFEIQEGKGDLKSRITELRKKWEKEIPEGPIMVFDREGSGKAFFRNLLEHLGESARLVVVTLNGKPAGCAFLLTHADQMEIPWASTLREFNTMGINMFMYWKVLEHAVTSGYVVFDFGRCSKDAGTYRFKQQWGAQPIPMHWDYCLPEGDSLPELNPNNPKFKLLIAVWQRLPVWLTRLIGPPVVKNLP